MRATHRVLLWAAVAAIPLATPARSADELTADQVVEKANHMAYYQGKDGRATVKMTITDSQGRTRERKFTILRKDVKDGGDQKFYVYFKSPSDVRRMTYLVWKNTAKDDDRWLYLPALDLVKRVAASDKRTSFVGAHFFYEDVSGRSLKDDRHAMVSSTDRHYVIDNEPKNTDEVEFSRYRVYIDKKTFLPLKAIYYDKSKDKRKYRVVEALDIKLVQNRPTVTRSRVTDLRTGGNTVSEFSGIKYDIDLKDRIFTERFLRRPPREARR